MKRCKIEGCPNKSKCRGWCNKHYLRWFFHGDPLFIKIAERGQGCTVAIKGRVNYKTRFVTVESKARGKKTTIREHIYLAEDFIIHRRLKKGEMVHHKDENPLNNSLDNLEVMTRSKHARIHKLHISCPSDKRAKKLIIEQVREIRALLARGMTPYRIAKILGIGRGAIWGIQQGRSWKDQG